MPNFDVEMLWNCSSCDTCGIGGTYDHCPNCGNAHDTKKDPWYMPEDTSYKNRIIDSRKIQMAHAGPNWICQFCGGTQRRPDGSCLNCAGPRDEIVAEKLTGRSLEDSIEAQFLGSNSSRSRSFSTQKDVDFYRHPERRMWKIAAIVIVAVIFIAGLSWILFRQRPVDLEVVSVEWRHSIHVERYKQVAGDGFDEDRPSDARNIRNQGSRVHHHEKVFDHNETVHFTVSVPDGQDCRNTPRSCYKTSVSCRSNNNGTASCSGGDEVCSGGDEVCTPRYRNEDRTREDPVYRNEPRYEDYYTWTVWRWKPERDVSHSGYTLQTDWPNREEICLNCGCVNNEQERESGRSVSYAVTFVDKQTSEIFSHAPDSEANFKRFPLGSKHQALYSVAMGLDFQSVLK